MGFISEFRTSLENPQTPLSFPAEWLLDMFNGGRTDSGIRVSELTAFQCTTFLACVDLIAGSLASLPKHVFERTIVANGRASHRVAFEHGYYDLINLEPNEEMSRFVFDKAFMAHVLAWGNGYAEIQRDAGNAAVAMWPRNPNVPPHMVGVTEKTSRANVEQIGQEFLTFSLRPDLKCWEQEYRRKLFPRATIGRNAGRKFGVFFDTWPLVTPAANDLRTFIQAMVQWGVWAPNDARERLNDNPIDSEAADNTWMQINMAPTDQLYQTPALSSDGSGGASGDANKDRSDRNARPILVERVSRAYMRLFSDAFGRIKARSAADLKDFRQVFLPVLMAIGEELERQAGELMHSEASPEPLENSRFLTGYIETMHHRAQNESWSTANGNSDTICVRELRRAVRSLAVEAYRNVATAAAKQHTEGEPS
jgi:hypothetical protein